MAVMADASAVRATGIQVVSGAQVEGAQSADANRASAGAAEHKDVCAGLGGRLGLLQTRGRRRGALDAPKATPGPYGRTRAPTWR
jgi:hypothetical protein